MNKLTTSIIALVAVLTAVVIATATSASTPTVNAEGQCLDGSHWTLNVKRSGSNIDTTFTVQNTLKNSPWAVNYAFIPSNKVSYQMIKSDKRGKLVAKYSFPAAGSNGVYIFTDNVGIMYCIAYAGF